MKATSTLTLLGLFIAGSLMAQNQITTPSGQPLVIGNNGVKLSNMNSATTTSPTNGKVLTVNAEGLLFLAPDAGGPWTTSGSNVHYTGNVGIGTTNPLQRLHVNGDINIPNTGGIRFNDIPFLRAIGTNNVMLGSNAGNNTLTGQANIFIGNESGKSNTTGNDNFFAGTQAGQANTTGRANIFIGPFAGVTNTTGIVNTYIGTSAGQQSNGNYNFAIGYRAGQFATGSTNMYIGFDAGKGVSLETPNSGAGNTFLGYLSGEKNTTGNSNTFISTNSGSNNSSGYRNVFIGSGSGTANTTGFQNTLIGTLSNVITPTLSNATAIGYNSSVACSNCFVLGGTGANQVKVGIGNTSPTAFLHVKAGGTTVTGVRFENLPPSTGTLFQLYVDADGNIMRSNTSNAREMVGGSSNWTITDKENLVNLNSGGVIIGNGIKETPSGYKLYVSEGVLTEKVKVAVKNSSDWSDHVFDSTYKLRSLEDTELFIKKYKHLPGIPSAEEMVKVGNDLHKTDALLLEKIEELTLYLLELKKDNEILQREVNNLKLK